MEAPVIIPSDSGHFSDFNPDDFLPSSSFAKNLHIKSREDDSVISVPASDWRQMRQQLTRLQQRVDTLESSAISQSNPTPCLSANITGRSGKENDGLKIKHAINRMMDCTELLCETIKKSMAEVPSARWDDITGCARQQIDCLQDILSSIEDE
jgi:hypothetical protein